MPTVLYLLFINQHMCSFYKHIKELPNKCKTQENDKNSQFSKRGIFLMKLYVRRLCWTAGMQRSIWRLIPWKIQLFIFWSWCQGSPPKNWHLLLSFIEGGFNIFAHIFNCYSPGYEMEKKNLCLHLMTALRMRCLEQDYT